MNNLHEDVQRWLIQENYSFNEAKTEEDNFKIIIKNADTSGNNLEIFEPKKQANILVIGIKIPLKNNQMMRFLKMSEKEKENFKKKITDYCHSIRAIDKFFDEDGTKKVGVYIVLDKKEQLNRSEFMKTLTKIIEMSDKTIEFLHYLSTGRIYRPRDKDGFYHKRAKHRLFKSGLGIIDDKPNDKTPGESLTGC